MAAYAIVYSEVRSTTWLAEYGPKTAVLIEKDSGKFLVRGGTMEGMEGDGELPSTIVVLEFPSMEHAKALVQRSRVCTNDQATAVRLYRRACLGGRALGLLEGRYCPARRGGNHGVRQNVHASASLAGALTVA